LYDIKTNTGHTHDAKNAANIDLADDSVDSEHYAAGSIDAEHYATGSIPKTALNTGTGTASGTVGSLGEVAVVMQDYCFFPSIYAAANDVRLNRGTTAGATYVGRFGLWNTDTIDNHAYTAYWRYVTATDEPFLYVVRDISTGDNLQAWACSDPPPGYWGLDEKPKDFEPPISIYPALTGVEEIVIFKYPMAGYRELISKSEKDKVPIHEMLTSTYDYNNGSKLFISKNLSMI